MTKRVKRVKRIKKRNEELAYCAAQGSLFMMVLLFILGVFGHPIYIWWEARKTRIEAAEWAKEKIIEDHYLDGLDEEGRIYRAKQRALKNRSLHVKHPSNHVTLKAFKDHGVN